MMGRETTVVSLLLAALKLLCDLVKESAVGVDKFDKSDLSSEGTMRVVFVEAELMSKVLCLLVWLVTITGEDDVEEVE